ncbi:MAG: magnesium transporter CorA family protein [Candidatus Gracilibacteria bacterium]|jgi:magnesium transporter
MIEQEIQKIQHGPLTWIDVENPDILTLNKFKTEYGFHTLDIEDCLSEAQRSKVDEYDDYLFVILNIPCFDKRKQQVVTEEVDIFIKNNLLITIHWGTLKPITDMFCECQKKDSKRKEFMGHSSGYLLYELIDLLFSETFPIITTLEKELADLEKEAFYFEQPRDLIKDILNAKKSIIVFKRTMALHRTVIAQIEHKNKKFLTDDLDVYFDDILDKVEKIWASLENLDELIESLQDTNESLISHTTGDVIKTLTVFNVIMLPLNLVAGMYGMNVALPMAGDGSVFLVLIGVMCTIVLAMLLFFKWKRWI